jgi:hypothetical protein
LVHTPRLHTCVAPHAFPQYYDGKLYVMINDGDHLLFVLRGPKSAAIKAWPSFWRSAAGVLRVRRGDALYNWRRDDLAVFMRDSCYTIRDQIFKSKS